MNMWIGQQPETQGYTAIRQAMTAGVIAAIFSLGIGSSSARAGACSDSHYGGTDVDCAIILCLVGGFGPSECKPAFGCFWHRLTRIPPKPPIGFCPMGSMTNSNFEDDDKAVFERTMNELESFGYPEGATSLRSVRATLYRSTKTCARGPRGEDPYDCTAIYRVNADGSEFQRTDIEGHFRGKKIEYVDGFGAQQTIGDAERKVSIPYNCSRQGRDEGVVCSYRTHWVPIARRID